MGKIRLDVPHSLPKADAKQRVEKLLSYWAQKYGVAASWSGDSAKLSGKVMGISLAADLEVREGRVDADATDPGFLFREKAKKYLTDKFNHYLDPKKSLADLE
jgi:putative polyhydroxyalkanoic acid system protein